MIEGVSNILIIITSLIYIGREIKTHLRKVRVLNYVRKNNKLELETRLVSIKLNIDLPFVEKVFYELVAKEAIEEYGRIVGYSYYKVINKNKIK